MLAAKSISFFLSLVFPVKAIWKQIRSRYWGNNHGSKTGVLYRGLWLTSQSGKAYTVISRFKKRNPLNCVGDTLLTPVQFLNGIPFNLGNLIPKQNSQPGTGRGSVQLNTGHGNLNIYFFLNRFAFQPRTGPCLRLPNTGVCPTRYTDTPLSFLKTDRPTTKEIMNLSC